MRALGEIGRSQVWPGLLLDERGEVARPQVFVPSKGIDDEACAKHEPLRQGDAIPHGEEDDGEVEPEVSKMDDATEADFTFHREAPVRLVLCR